MKNALELQMRKKIRSRRPIKAPTGAFPPNKSAGLSAVEFEIGIKDGNIFP
jgi:hypothetical protein